MLNLENGKFTIFTFQGKKCWRWTSKSQKWLQEIPSQLWRSHSWDGGRGRRSDGNSSIRLQRKAKGKYVHHSQCICLPLRTYAPMYKYFVMHAVQRIIVKRICLECYNKICLWSKIERNHKILLLFSFKNLCNTLIWSHYLVQKMCIFVPRQCCVQANKKELLDVPCMDLRYKFQFIQIYRIINFLFSTDNSILQRNFKWTFYCSAGN